MEITDEIKQVCSDLLERYKQAVKDSGHYASGDLCNTATYKINWDGKYFELYFNLEDYWKHIENGTKPHFPPISAIENWITVKHIIPSTNNGRVPTTKQLAYVIAREISHNGTKATKLLQKTIDSADDLIESLVNEITEQLQEELKEEYENIG